MLRGVKGEVWLAATRIWSVTLTSHHHYPVRQHPESAVSVCNSPVCDPLFLVGFPEFPRGVNTESIVFPQHLLSSSLIHRLHNDVLTHAGRNEKKQSIHFTRNLHCYTECFTQKSVWYPTMISQLFCNMYLWQLINFPPEWITLDNSWYSCGQPIGQCRTVNVLCPGREVWRVRCYNYPITPQHQSHWRPFLDAGLLEKKWNGEYMEFQMISRYVHRNRKIWQDLKFVCGSCRILQDLLIIRRNLKFFSFNIWKDLVSYGENRQCLTQIWSCWIYFLP